MLLVWKYHETSVRLRLGLTQVICLGGVITNSFNCSYFHQTYSFCLSPWWMRSRAVIGARAPPDLHSSLASPNSDPTIMSNCFGNNDCNLPTILSITLHFITKGTRTSPLWVSLLCSFCYFREILLHISILVKRFLLGSHPFTQLT